MTRRHTQRLAALVACLALAVPAACSSSTKSASPSTSARAVTTSTGSTAAPTSAAHSGPPDPCKLVPHEQVSALVEVTLPEPKNVGTGDDLMCQYVAPPDGPTAQVQIFTGGGALKTLQIDRDTLGHEFVQLEGIGDEAWLEDDNVFVCKGDQWVEVNVVALDVDEATIRSRLTEMAKTIVANL